MLTQELLKYLGILATSWMSRDAVLDLERVPTWSVVDSVNESRSALNQPDRVAIYRLLAKDQRQEVRARLTQVLMEDQHLGDVHHLAEELDPRVQALAAEVLRIRLAQAPPELRTEVATLFALSLKPGPRLTLARALHGNVPAECDFLYVLANDANALVRDAALSVTLENLGRSPEPGISCQTGGGVLDVVESRLHDPSARIRKKARRGFIQAIADNSSR